MLPTAPDFGLKSVIAGEPTTTPTDCVVVFPATSVAEIGITFVPDTRVAVHETDPLWMVAGLPLQEALAIPERLSATVPVTCWVEAVVMVLFAGDVMDTVGPVLSIFSVTDALAFAPFASVAVAEITWLAPSVLTVCVGGHWTGATPPVQV
jgi:hypothetical protein